MAKKKKRIIDEEVTATSADFTDSNFMLMDGSEGSKKVPMDLFADQGHEYTAGNGIDITDDTISVDTDVVATKTDLDSKQDNLTEGTGIDLTNDVISVDTDVVATKTDLDSKQDTLTMGDGISIETGSTGTTVTNTDHVYKETVEGTLDGTVYTVNVPDDTYALVEVPLTATELVVNVGEAGDSTTVSESYFQFTLADGSVLDDILVKQNGAECLLMGPMSYPSKVTYQGRVVNGIATIIGYSPVFYNKEWIGAGNGVLLTAGNGVKFAFHNKEV